MTEITFHPSAYLPLAIGFFGLAVGYFVWGGQLLFGFPKPSPEVNRTIALWAFWMAGFMQFLTGVYIIVGMTWFDVFGNVPPLYMAGIAFTAYGVHWFVLAHRRFIGASSEPDAWMLIPFFLMSLLGLGVFAAINDYPLVILFVFVTLIYLAEFPAKFGHQPRWERLVGLWQFLAGFWLVYLTYATALNASLGYHWWL